MTETFSRAFGQVPVSSYESLLSQRDGLSLNVMTQGIVTISGTPGNVTIVPPDVSQVETVSSLDYADYSGIGAITAPSGQANVENGVIDKEMQNSIWANMAVQDNNLLVYNDKIQQEAEFQNQPTYSPLVSSLDAYDNRTNVISTTNAAPTQFPLYGNSHVHPRAYPQAYYGRYDETSPCLFRYLAQRVYQAY